MSLPAYLNKVLSERQRLWNLKSLRFEAVVPKPSKNAAATPIVFGDKRFGFLVAEDGSADLSGFKSQLEWLAAQLACLFNSSNQARAIAVDQVVHEIAKSQPGKYHWTGVYMLTAPGTLTLEAFRGEPTPHVIIPVDRGICGAAVREEKTLNIPDVSADSRYLSCSIKTKSEIVVPIFKNDQVVGEIDIDSHVKNAFSATDESSLSFYARKISEI